MSNYYSNVKGIPYNSPPSIFTEKDLPEILAGPIIRRTDTQAVYIWIACKRPMIVRGRIYLYKERTKIKEEEYIGTGISYTQPFGKNLHVALVAIQPNGKEAHLPNVSKQEYQSKEGTKSAIHAFPADKLMGYNLEFQSFENAEASIEPDELAWVSLSKMMDTSDIVFEKIFNLPTFFIPQDTPPNFLQGSCRRPHGDDYDGFQLVYPILEESYNNLANRPSTLFLTGDQIYADDVSHFLIDPIRSLAIIIMGFKEQIYNNYENYPFSAPPTAKDNIEVCRYPGGHRDKLVLGREKEKLFTAEPDAACNHLLSFGEFVAMYLLVWNPDLWKKIELDSSKSYVLQDPSLLSKENIEDLQKQLGNMNLFKEGLWKVRAAMANMTTYMMFDDHDITDDWDRTFDWKKINAEHSTTRRVIANGLAAYWLFQGWGNDPKYYEKEAIKRYGSSFEQPLIDYFAKQNRQKITDFEERVLNHKHWSYIVPSPIPIIVLDTRTLRGYDTKDGAPRLLDQYGLLDLQNKLSQLNVQGKTIIIISPAPAMGLPAMEWITDRVAGTTMVKKVTSLKTKDAADLEGWRSNLSGFTNFILTIHKAKPKHCIFLSGDVHFGYLIKGALQDSRNHSTPFTQFTSSSFKYKPQGVKEIALIGAGRFSDALKKITYFIGRFNDASAIMKQLVPLLKLGDFIHIINGKLILGIPDSANELDQYIDFIWQDGKPKHLSKKLTGDLSEITVDETPFATTGLFYLSKVSNYNDTALAGSSFFKASITKIGTYVWQGQQFVNSFILIKPNLGQLKMKNHNDDNPEYIFHSQGSKPQVLR